MNYKKGCLLLTVTVIISLHASSQKKQFTIAEATNGMSTTLAPKSIKNACWQPGTDDLWQTDKENDKDIWKVTHISNGELSTHEVEQGTYPEKVTAIPAIKW